MGGCDAGMWEGEETITPTFMHNDNVSPGVDDEGLQQPGHAQADQEVEDVAADGVADGHVAVARPHHRHAGQRVLHADGRRHEGEAHDGVGEAERVADDGDHPHQQVAVQADPEHRHREAEEIRS